jgi:hypothetical protein
MVVSTRSGVQVPTPREQKRADMPTANDVSYRLSHGLAHYRFRCPSSSIVPYMFSCRSQATTPALRDSPHRPPWTVVIPLADGIRPEERYPGTRPGAARLRRSAGHGAGPPHRTDRSSGRASGWSAGTRLLAPGPLGSPGSRRGVDELEDAAGIGGTLLGAQRAGVRVRGEQRHARARREGNHVEAVPVDQAEPDQRSDELGAAVGDDLAARLGLQPAISSVVSPLAILVSGQEASRSVRENTTLGMSFIGAALMCELWGQNSAIPR